MNIFNKYFFALFFISLLLVGTASGLAGCGNNEQEAVTVNGFVVATVNEEEITEGSLEEYLKLVSFFVPGMEEAFQDEEHKDQVKEEVLWLLVENAVLLQEAERLEITVDEEDLEEIYQEGRQEMVQFLYGSEDEYEAAMERLDIEKEQLMRIYKEGQLLTNLFQHLEEEVTNEYVEEIMEKSPHYFTRPAQADVSHILFQEKEDALEMLEELEEGHDFVELAREKEDGRFEELGYIEEDGMFDPIFLEAAFALDSGEVSSEPVESSFGYHLILVKDMVPAKALDMDEDREEILQITNDLFIDEYVNNLMDKAEIETFL